MSGKIRDESDNGAGVQKGLVWIALILVLLPLVAAICFMLIEGWGFLDSLYMSVITLSTVGFQEIHPLSDGGRVFVIVYIMVGLSFFVFGTAELGEAILRGQLRKALGRRRVDSILKHLTEHFVICGYGRMGTNLCRDLARNGHRFAVVDRDPARLDAARAEGWPTVAGDATDDAVLEQAGLSRAAGLACVLPTDADNLYVVMSARLACSELLILARATDERTDEKMRRAGANRVVNLHRAGAHRMGQLLTNPKLQDFIEVLGMPGEGLEMAQFAVSRNAPYCGQKLSETDLQENGVIVVGIQKPDGECLMPPTGAAAIGDGDVLTVLGSEAGMKQLLAGSS